MLRPDRLDGIAQSLVAMPPGAQKDLRVFLADAAQDATTQALSLEAPPEKREALCGYAQAMRDVFQHVGDLMDGSYREWPQVKAWLAARREGKATEGT